MLKYDASAGRISQYFSQIPVNTEFRIGYTSPTACIQRCYEICSTISDIPMKTCLFTIVCSAVFICTIARNGNLVPSVVTESAAPSSSVKFPILTASTNFSTGPAA